MVFKKFNLVLDKKISSFKKTIEVDADKSIVPVLASIVNPLGVAVNVPPVVPVMFAEGSLPSVQNSVVPP